MANSQSLTALFASLQQEAYGAEAVVAADHGGKGVLHPAVVEVAAAGGELLHEPPHRLPRTVAESLGLLPAHGDPAVALPHLARVLDRVLVQVGEVVVLHFPDGGDFDVEGGHWG